MVHKGEEAYYWAQIGNKHWITLKPILYTDSGATQLI